MAFEIIDEAKHEFLKFLITSEKGDTCEPAYKRMIVFGDALTVSFT